MKKFHYKNINQTTSSERNFLLGFIDKNKYELREFEKSFDGCSLLVKAEFIEIDNIEKYLKDNGFNPCCWSPEVTP